MADEILSIAQMYAADRAAMAAGVAGTTLMENAGRAVAGAIQSRWEPCPVSILCGPGNNGGDGFVVARHLAEAGWPVRLGLLGDAAALGGDAGWAASTWSGPVERAGPELLDGAGLVVDALYGAGLGRPLDGASLELARAMADRGIPVVAVDVPSGLNGDTGAVMGGAAQADLTVTFFRKKPGHLLLPGRALCGTVLVADIGIPESVLEGLGTRLWENTERLWVARYPWPRLDGHKYSRGHALVLGGRVMTGAARLAARAALRVGAGLVTIAADPEAWMVYSLSMPSVIVQPVPDGQAFQDLLADRRRNAVLIGPGAGASAELRGQVRAAVDAGKAGVLDADVFGAFSEDLKGLAAGLESRWLLTPHGGEFARLFGDIPGSKLDQARRAAALAGTPVLLKGADTVVAHPDGRAVVNSNAPPDLATAGSGDTLAGLAVGLIAQGVDAFDAGCMAAWLHGELGTAVGPGLIAEDLAEALPGVLRRLKATLPDQRGQ
ncbi:bifunctional ADP-dependent NAD(P)H-hydrate dehydratase/NAD(P)H-hydrate epimerase [Aerophototrophica crusticola]|uniref:Bifunctional NAD(P)H-hydrate repair enzyme n=1 Tax=Aerophototrophica crusticola TaxID=1709002 RepID=A0A858R6C1_9PROT|nr:bifunctional ADP-dependent NAD(P)H-hydrate dehydratase/NAD(P)H-hydrate epimerase [Rhodospirillaceae bacterium B3]